MRISIQQLLRLGILILWLFSNVAAFQSPQNIYVDLISIVAVNVIFITYFILTSYANISVVTYTFVGTFFILQRIMMIFISQDNFAYLGKFTVDSNAFNQALLFIAWANIIIIFIARRYREPFCQSPIYQSRLLTSVIRHYPIVFITFWVIKKAIQFRTGIQFTGYGIGTDPGLLSRVIEIGTAANIFLYLGIYLFPKHNKLHIVGCVLLLIDFLLAGSKAALLSFICSLGLCHMFLISYRIRLKYIIVAGLLFALTFLYAPAAMSLRGEIISSHLNISFADLPMIIIRSYHAINIDNFNKYAQLTLSRMGLVDWLAAFIYFGRGVFNTDMNLYSLFLSIANAIIPSFILHNPYTNPVTFITQIWTSKLEVSRGELLGIYGSMYIYLGYYLGILALVAWLWYSCYFVQKYNRLFGILYIWQFVLGFMLDGLIETHVRAAVNIAVLILIYSLFLKITRSSTKKANWAKNRGHHQFVAHTKVGTP